MINDVARANRHDRRAGHFRRHDSSLRPEIPGWIPTHVRCWVPALVACQALQETRSSAQMRAALPTA